MGGLEASDPPHLGPIDEFDVAALAPDQALPLHVGEDAVDVEGGLALDVGNLLLSERIGQAVVSALHPCRRFAQQVRDARGRIPPSAVDQPFVANVLIALEQAAEEALKLGMLIDQRIEITRLADHPLAAHDGLDTVKSRSLARQDPFAGEAERDDLAAA